MKSRTPEHQLAAGADEQGHEYNGRCVQRSAEQSGQLGCSGAELYRVTEDEKVISQDEITDYAYHPVWDVIQRELVSAGFTQAEGAERLLAWRLA